jgi:hypothetical protein
MYAKCYGSTTGSNPVSVGSTPTAYANSFLNGVNRKNPSSYVERVFGTLLVKSRVISHSNKRKGLKNCEPGKSRTGFVIWNSAENNAKSI